MTQVSYDKRAISIDGQRILLLSGAVHYPRSTPQMWSPIMQRSKEAGLNTIETYVFWNLHERQQGVFDFSERLDLYHFCELAQAHNLNVILRIGPYICAETSYGGLPIWLRDVPEIQMRTYNEPFMREMSRWIRYLVNYLKPLFAPNGGPIMLAQIENEYDNITKIYGESGRQYLEWTSQLATSLDLGIPWIMCKGAAAGTIGTINDFYGHRELERHYSERPDQPALWTEAWPGWYNTFGYPQHARTPQDMAYAVARFFAGGGAGINYYMWHGGTNFNREAMYLQATDYNFDAPLDEYGLPTTKLNHLKRLHGILNELSNLLVDVERPDVEQLGPAQYVFSYRSSMGSALFVCNDSREAASVNIAGVAHNLSPQSVCILRDEIVLMDTSDVQATDTVIRVMQPSTTALSWSYWREPLPTTSNTDIVVSTPLEQLQFTHDQTDYCWYTTQITITEGNAGKGPLILDRVADMAHIFVDGIRAAKTALPLQEQRGDIDTERYSQTVELDLSAGEHTLSILCSAVGTIKGDWMLGGRNMVHERKGLWGAVHWKDQLLDGKWHISPGVAGEHLQLYAAGARHVVWEPYTTFGTQNNVTWWRMTFKHPGTGQLPLTIDLQGMGKGVAWLNGRCIGRYWLIPSVDYFQGWLKIALDHPVINTQIGAPTQRYYHLPEAWLQANNVLTLFEEFDHNPSSVQLAYSSLTTVQG